MEKPARIAQGGYIGGMEFTDWLIVKFVVVVVGAFLYGLFGGVSRDSEEGPSDADRW